jgi:U32 family peptidase
MPSAPELLAPAGDWDCVRAAIENGADAVYFGLDCGFNARARAANFPLDDLPELMRTLHARGLKGYATLNVLVFSEELPEFERVVRACDAAGVDAVLVQDVGAARLIREICPALPMHASTQMTLTSAESITLAETLGMERVVVARELSIEEIISIRRQTTLPLEVFVHGALCVAYSGQCLTSESLGGRSANRGQCAQACRLPYDLVCDGKDVDLGDQKYLLSPQDLAAYALAPELLAAGVASFKIEGRLKAPEYVANITRHYRRAIDAAAVAQPAVFAPQDVEEMELSFSRGFSPGWLHGCDHKMLVPATSSAKRGVRLGRVAAVRNGRVTVDLAAGLAGGIKRGDGVAFDCGATSDDAIGGRVYEVFQAGRSLLDPVVSGRVELTFARNGFDSGRLAPGQTVWKTDDPQLTSRLRKTFTNEKPLRRQPVDLHATVAVGLPLTVTATTAAGTTCTVASAEPAREAMKHPLDHETLRAQFGRLGGTAFELRDVTADISGRPMLPLSILGAVRKELIVALENAAAGPRARARGWVGEERSQEAAGASRRNDSEHNAAETALPHSMEPGVGGNRGEWAYPRPSKPRFSPPLAARRPDRQPRDVPTLHICARSLPQLQSVLDLGERHVYADFADIRHYREAVAMSRGAGATIHLATPRIQKPDEIGIFHLMAKQEPDGILVRNYGALRFFREQGIAIVGDFSLNVTNELSAAFFMHEGLARVTASYDCNREQLLMLVAAIPPAWLEVVIHQHMPMFHMEHCVFCAVLSPGTNKTNCGRPCDEHVVKLRDRIGVEHPLTADVGCRNTLYNATPQSAAEAVPALRTGGVGHFRIELLDEQATEIREIITVYRDLLAGRVGGRDVWTQLKAMNRVGITRGTLEEKKNPLAIV